MKKLLTFLSVLCMTCAVGGMTACNISFADPNQGSESTADSSSKAETASYTVEYWFEAADGYQRNDDLTVVEQGQIGKTVQISLQNFEGYFFESNNPDNVLRGRVKEDGSLVLKAYYSLDYSNRVTIETELSDVVDILKGEEKQLEVTVLLDGAPITEGVVYKAEDNNVQISQTGVMTGKMRGETTVSVSYKNVSKSFNVCIWDAYIANEADWWKVYENTALWYKFTDDVTLSENVIEHFTDAEAGVQGYLYNPSFEGVIDGGGYSLSYNGSRLFNWVNGQIRNITFNAGEGFYWGAPIAYGCTGGIITNVTVNAAYNTSECLRAVSADFWIKLGGNEGVDGNGGMFGMIETGTVISDCTVYLDVRRVNSDGFGGIAYQSTNSVVENCKIYSTNADMPVIKLDVGETTTITNCTVEAIENCNYTVEYYFETEDGFVKNDAYTYVGTELNGNTVTANTTLGVSGFEFDADNENNVLSGVVQADGSLVLKVYYKKAAVTVVIESDHAEAFEMDKSATVTIPVTVTANGEAVTEGIVWTSGDENIVTVADGVVSVVKGGVATVTASYMGMHKTFTVTAYNKFISTEADWWTIYESEDSLAGWYKLVNDVTLTKNSVEYFNESGLGHTINHTFAGVLDGNNFALHYNSAGSNRLFYWISGTIKNMTINNGTGYYWGAPIAYGLSGTAENLTVNAIFERAECWFAANKDLWIQLGGDAGLLGNAGMFAWLDYATVTNCHVTITILDTVATTDGFGGLAYGATEAKITDCTVTVKGGALPLIKQDNNSTIVNSFVKDFAKGNYTVEYYFETENGFVKNEEYTVNGEAYLGETVAADTTLAVEGFYYDVNVAENVIRGTIGEETLVLKVYYKETIIASIESDHAEAFEMDKSATVTIPVTVKANGKPVTEGIVWTSGDENIVTVADGVVSVVKGGVTTVTVSYMGTSKTFTVTAYNKFITSEADWWTIYENADTLAGWYKLANDVTLTKSSADYYEGAYNASETFTGKIDGNGKTLTYTGNRLFCWMNGATIENINLVADNGFYWGSGLAFAIQGGSVIRNVTADFTFVHSGATYVNPVIGWITVNHIGAVCIYLTDATLDNVDVKVTLTDAAKNGGTFYGLATEMTNSVATNCNVTSLDELALFQTQAGTNDTTGSTFTKIELGLNGIEESAIEMLSGAEKNLEISANYAGEDKSSEVVYTVAGDSVTVVGGVVTAVKGGVSTVTASFMGKTLTYTVTVYTKYITSEADWWTIYENADTLAGWYKLANDVTLTKTSADYYEGAYNASETFTGKIDGNGKTLTYTGNRLFCWMNGATIENINLVADNGFYWGSGLAFGIQGGSVIRNVTADFTFVYSGATYVNPVVGWITVNHIGAVCIYLTDATLDNVDVKVTLTDAAKNGGTFYGLATEMTNSVATNCNVTSLDELALFQTQAGTNDTTGSTFTKIELGLNGIEESAIEMLSGAEKNLEISANYAGEDKSAEVVYTVAGDSVTVVGGVVTAVKGGVSTVTASFMGKTLTYTVTVYTKYITSEADWWTIYENADTLAGWYKLANDVTLTKTSADYYEGAYNASETFTGKIDGNGKTLTYTGNRLFCWMNGATIENINLVADNGFYWGSGLAFAIQGGSVIRNVTADFTFVYPNATYVNPVIGWVTVNHIGAVCIYLTDATLDNVDVKVTLTDAAKNGGTFYGLATEITNSVATNCNVTSLDELALFQTQAGTNDTTGSDFTKILPQATEIATEADFWAMYESAVQDGGFLKITGNYRLMADITLTEVPANKYADPSFNFAGTLDGNGKTLTYGGSRLFAVMYGGKIENINLVLTSGCYLGSAIAFDIKNATFKDINMTANFDTPKTYYVGIEQAGTGVLGVWMDASTVDNVDIQVSFSGEAANNPMYFCGISQNLSNSQVLNCDITAPVDIGLADNMDAATVTTGSSVTVA